MTVIPGSAVMRLMLRALVAVIGVAMLLGFATYVWPTRYLYFQGAGPVMWRMDRFTQRLQRFEYQTQAWKPYQPR